MLYPMVPSTVTLSDP